MVGGWGEIKIKAKLSPAEAGVWAELGNIDVKNMHVGGTYLMLLLLRQEKVPFDCYFKTI